MKQNGFYLIKDSFFERFKDPGLKDNKNQRRPYYYCFKEERNTDIYWMVPLSSRIEKYKRIIEAKEKSGKKFHGVHICRLPNKRYSAFLIQDMFPILKQYVYREYMIGNSQMFLRNRKDKEIIEYKTKKIFKLIKRGIKITPHSPKVFLIREKLLKEED